MKPFEPIQLGPVQLHSNVVQGPLAGYSCAPFRALAWEYGKPGFAATEMISAKGLLLRKKIPRRYTERDPREKLLCYQLAANEPEVLGRATAFISTLGVELIDLNCGCPVKRQRANGTGSRLLGDPELIYALVRAMKENTAAAVSIKMRVAGGRDDQNDLAVLQAAESGGVDFITVHGRHWRERYDVPCRYDAIRDIVQHAKVPIFANGDVSDAASLKAIFEETGCAGVMVARAGVGQPWLLEQMRAELAGEPFKAPSAPEVAEILLRHITELAALDSERAAILQSRKLAKYYARCIVRKRDFVIGVQEAKSLAEITDWIKRYFFVSESEPVSESESGFDR